MVTRAGLKSEFWGAWCSLRSVRMWKVVIWCQRGLSAGFGWDRVGFLPGAGLGLCWARGEDAEMFLWPLSGARTEPRPCCFNTLGRSWGAREDGGATAGMGDIPDHGVACSVHKVGGRRRRRGYLEWCCLSSRVTIPLPGPCSPAILSTCLAMGSRECFPCFALLACTLGIPC